MGKYIDDQDREYESDGDTMTRGTPGDNALFDHHVDGTSEGYWTSRYGSEVLKADSDGILREIDE